MRPLYYHQQARPGHQNSKSGKPQYFSLFCSASQPKQSEVELFYVVLLQTVAFQLQIALPVQRGVKPGHYPGLFDNLRMNKKVQTIVDIIGTDGKKKKVKAACCVLLQPGPPPHISRV